MALQSLARPPSNENFQWALTDSNRRPSACKADALPAELNFHINGAADEARTRYLHLGKVALYQMSYGRMAESLVLSRSLRATNAIIWHSM